MDKSLCNSVENVSEERTLSNVQVTDLCTVRLKGLSILCGELEVGFPLGYHFFICDYSVLENLSGFSDYVPSQKVCGLACPYLYVGATNSVFVWYIKSAVIPKYGCMECVSSKIWFLVPDEKLQSVKCFLDKQFNYNVGPAVFLNCIGDITSMECMSSTVDRLQTQSEQKQKIAVTMVVQNASEFSFICRNSSSLGPTIREAAMYAKEVRMMGSLFSLDLLGGLQPSEDVTKPLFVSEQQSFLGKSSPVSQLHEVSHTTLSQPSRFNLQYENVTNPQELKVEETELFQMHIKTEELGDSETDQFPNFSVEPPLVNSNIRIPTRSLPSAFGTYTKRLRSSGRKLSSVVECPHCDKTFKGKNDRLDRLLVHVRKRHKYIGHRAVSDAMLKFGLVD